MCRRAFLLLLVIYVATCTRHERADRCDRTPAGAMGKSKMSGSNGFQVMVVPYMMTANRNGAGGNVTLEGYAPGEMYTVKLMGRTTRYTVQTFRAFTLVALDDSGNPAGQFQGESQADGRQADGMDNSGSTTNPMCPYGVHQSSLSPKTEAHATWTAPVQDSGCVTFRAAVLQYGNTWYMDDDHLSRRFCASANFAARVPDDSAKECCACDEAKYELLFDGKWSRHTHPKDFPHLVHLTHFSDILGASHSPRYAMWHFGTYASDGLKELAEWGNTYKMEREMRDKAKEIRTIIKARGLWFPNVEGQAKAAFRVDKYHHLLSLASMFGPSPDWLVGVSDINLCTADCSWSPERRFDLYPWDAGTDSGISYMSPNNPTVPRAKISPITTKEPADARAPFYDPDSDAMPPLASLILRRVMVYPSTCKTVQEYQVIAANSSANSEDEEYGNRRECMVGEWTPWSLCSATCGKGIRMRSRVYKFPVKAQMFNCDRQVTEKQFCNARTSVCEGSDAFNVDSCAMQEWAQWTECTVTCGEGVRTRTRNYADPSTASSQNCQVALAATESCTGEHGSDCEKALNVDPRCRTTAWSDWSPCSSSCGPGVRVRTRLFHFAQHRAVCEPDTELMQQDNCEVQTCQRFFHHYGPDVCDLEMVVGQCHGTFPRYYYNKETNQCRRFIYTGCKGNHNQFETEEQCKKLCVSGYDPNSEALATSPTTTTTTTTTPPSTTTTIPATPKTTTTTTTTTTTYPTTPSTIRNYPSPEQFHKVESNAIEDLAPNNMLNVVGYNNYMDGRRTVAPAAPYVGDASRSSASTASTKGYVPALLASSNTDGSPSPHWQFQPVYDSRYTTTTRRPAPKNRYYEYRPDLGYWVPTYGHGRSEIATYAPTTTVSTTTYVPPVTMPPQRLVKPMKLVHVDNNSVANTHDALVEKMMQTSKELAEDDKSATLIPSFHSTHNCPTFRCPSTLHTLLTTEISEASLEFTGMMCLSTVPDNALASELGVSLHGSISDGGEPVDCMVTEWSAWSDCSRTCGNDGNRVRTRAVKVFARNAGRPCPENMQQRRACRQRPCPRPMCFASRWSAWGPCSESCAPHGRMHDASYPQQRRFRHVHGDRGAQCTLDGVQKKPCVGLPMC